MGRVVLPTVDVPQRRSTRDAPPLQAILHADDCGLSVGITEGIMACFDRGGLHRTSVVANGHGWEHAVAALRQRPGLAVALHLNFFEGTPLSKPGDVDLLVDRQGRFHRGFAAVWAHGLVGARAARLRAQVRLELRQQIERFLSAFADRGPLAVDGHVHYHVLPPVCSEVLALCAEYPIGMIRLPRELLYWPRTRGAPRPPLVNVAKNLILRALCHRVAPALRRRSLTTTEAFVGVLGTGSMTLSHVRAALEHLRRQRTSGRVEILFHPGRAQAHEAALWEHRPELQAFYLSPHRERESELLQSAALDQLLSTYELVENMSLRPTRPRETSS